MKSLNQAIGNLTERQFIIFLLDHNYWCYQLPTTINGQCFDVVASKNNIFFAFEVKHCKKDLFSLSRIEDNQINSYFTLSNAKTSNYFIVFKFDSDLVNVFRYITFEECYNTYILNDVKSIKKSNLEVLNVDYLL